MECSMNIGAIYIAVDQHGRLCSAQLAVFGSLYLPASGGKSCENNKNEERHMEQQKRGEAAMPTTSVMSFATFRWILTLSAFEYPGLSWDMQQPRVPARADNIKMRSMRKIGQQGLVGTCRRYKSTGTFEFKQFKDRIATAAQVAKRTVM